MLQYYSILLYMQDIGIIFVTWMNFLILRDAVLCSIIKSDSKYLQEAEKYIVINSWNAF